MVGDGAATLVARAFEASGVERPADALERFLALYDERLLQHTRPTLASPSLIALSRRGRARRPDEQAAAPRRGDPRGLDLARYFRPTARGRRRRAVSAQAGSAGLLHLAAAAGATPRRRCSSAIRWSTGGRRARRPRHLSRAIRIWLREFSLWRTLAPTIDVAIPPTTAASVAIGTLLDAPVGLRCTGLWCRDLIRPSSMASALLR